MTKMKSQPVKQPITEYIDDKKPTLKECQDFVGGPIQIVNDDNGRQIVFNEEGKLTGELMNYEATCEWACGYDYIVGNAMILSGKAKLT